MDPEIRKQDRHVLLNKSTEASRVMRRNAPYTAKHQTIVHKEAEDRVRACGGDIHNESHILGQYEMQVGQYVGKTFKWLLENDVGYTCYILRHIHLGSEKECKGVAINDNKFSLYKYLTSFEAGRDAMAAKIKLDKKRSASTQSQRPSQSAPGSGGGSGRTTTSAPIHPKGLGGKLDHIAQSVQGNF